MIEFKLILLLFCIIACYSLEVGIDSHNTLEYDYIVLGAGTAGSVIASKLSDDKTIKVLLVEEGPFIKGNQIVYSVDNWFTKMVSKPNYAIIKEFHDVPQKGLVGKSFKNVRGKMVGGSGSANAMVMIQATVEDFNDWAEITGNNEWSWKSISKEIPEFESRFDYYRLNSTRVLFPELRRAIEGLGYQFLPDTITTGKLSGYHTCVFMMKHNQTSDELSRISSWTQFVEKDLFEKNKTNLDVVINERAEKLDFADMIPRKLNAKNKNHVKGVYLRNTGTNKVTYVRAKKEVIISMGSYESPKFLQLNGIGDQDFLESLNIQSIVNSTGVGQGLKDHLYTSYVGKPLHPKLVNLTIPQRSPIHDGFNIYGPVNQTRPDFSVNANIINGRFTCSYEMTKSSTSGYVELRSNDPNDDLIIDENIFTLDKDNQLYSIGLKTCLQIQDSLVKQGVLDGNYKDTLYNATWENLLDYTKSHASLNYHPCCTVKMGPDNASPLDSQLFVKGIDNLRVIDSSIFPTQTTMNPNVPLILLSSRASKLILKK